MSTIRTLQQPRAKRTRRQLLAAARRVFADRGYRGATVDEVTNAAGCSKGAFYFHFASKEAALVTLLDGWAAERAEALADAANGHGSPKQVFASTLETLLVRRRDAWDQRLVLEFWSEAERNPTIAKRLALAQRLWRRQLIETFTRAREAGALPRDLTPEHAANAALTLHHGLMVQACLRASDGTPERDRSGAALAVLAT